MGGVGIAPGWGGIPGSMWQPVTLPWHKGRDDAQLDQVLRMGQGKPIVDLSWSPEQEVGLGTSRSSSWTAFLGQLLDIGER